MTRPPLASEPLLRTLAPALRQLEHALRAWLDGPHRYPLPTMARATLEGLHTDLRRSAEALDVDRPLLVVMLMGGTGVGKSTLLNALAGGAVAQASFARPTTRDPVVYYHEAVRPERLDPALQRCRLAAHDRVPLEQKILVDTPDLDSNDLANRDKLAALLPVADVVLYVGSQEKYHDQLGWELFREQRRRRAFAFVLNKWDRCTHATATGVRPDDDLRRDLAREGFAAPLLFRTCAQRWVDVGDPFGSPADLPEGEQFRDLVGWLERGLSRLEIEAIKARGVGQLLRQFQDALTAACPPDLADAAERTRFAWVKVLADEAADDADVLLNALDPYQREIEHHFALEGQRRFHGLMAGYLQLFTRARFAGSSLRSRLPLVGKSANEPAPAWDLATFTRACSEAASTRHLDARRKALANRLLLAADAQGWALDLLTDPVEQAAQVDWRQRHAVVLGEVLERVERDWTQPEGTRGWLQTLIVFVADWLPPVALLGVCALLLWEYTMQGRRFEWGDLVLPLVVLLFVLILLHSLIALLLPLRWPKIRGAFRKQLEERIRAELDAVYAPVPGRVAEMLREERRRVEKLLSEAGDVARWLEEREQAASVAGLYGSE